MRPLADVVRAGLYLSSGEKRNPKATSRLTIVTSSIRLIIAMSFAAFAILNPESRLFSATVAVSIAGLTLMSLVGTGILLRREARRTPGAIGPKYVDVTDQYLGTQAAQCLDGLPFSDWSFRTATSITRQVAEVWRCFPAAHLILSTGRNTHSNRRLDFATRLCE